MTARQCTRNSTIVMKLCEGLMHRTLGIGGRSFLILLTLTENFPGNFLVNCYTPSLKAAPDVIG